MCLFAHHFLQIFQFFANIWINLGAKGHLCNSSQHQVGRQSRFSSGQTLTSKRTDRQRVTGKPKGECRSLCAARCCATWSRPCCRWTCSPTASETHPMAPIRSSTSPCPPSTAPCSTGGTSPASTVSAGNSVPHILPSAVPRWTTPLICHCPLFPTVWCKRAHGFSWKRLKILSRGTSFVMLMWSWAGQGVEKGKWSCHESESHVRRIRWGTSDILLFQITDCCSQTSYSMYNTIHIQVRLDMINN